MENNESKHDINLLDALIVLARYKTMVFTIVFSITLVSLGVSLIWPQSFRSTAVILPPVQQQSLSGLAGMLGGALPISLGGSPQISPEVILTILNSRSLRVEIVEEFDLAEAYGTDIMEEILMRLNEAITVEESREGCFGFNPIIALRISVTDEDPVKAQQVAEFIVSRVDETVNKINRDNATEQFQMLESRFERNLAELEQAENALRSFQETHGIIEIEEQGKALINTIATLRAEIVETEVAVAVLRETVNATNPELLRFERTLSALEGQYQSLLQRSEQQAGSMQVLPAMQDVPGLALEYYRLFREVTVQGRIYETLFPQYDFQKLNLESARRGIQVLDAAHLPTYKDAPRRAFIVLGGMVFSIFLSFLIVFYRNMMANGARTNSRRYQQIRELQEQLGFGRKSS